MSQSDGALPKFCEPCTCVGESVRTSLNSTVKVQFCTCAPLNQTVSCTVFVSTLNAAG
jgi:hypothetical protein